MKHHRVKKPHRAIHQTIVTLLLTYTCTLVPICGNAQPDISFDTPIYYSVTNEAFPTAETWGVAILDADLDGDLDIAAANRVLEKGCVSLLQNDGSGVFSSPLNFPLSSNPYRIFASDLNNDGYPDLITVNNSDPNPGGNSISVLINNGAGHFESRTDYLVSNYPSFGVAADFNNDNKPDLAIACSINVCLLLGDGTGSFGPTNVYYVGGQTTAITSGDFNEDGHLDLITGTLTIGTIRLLAGRGDGTFEPYETVATNNGGIIMMIAGDFNRDSHLDLVVSSRIGYNGFFAGIGDGTFQERVFLPYDGFSYRLTTNDLNGDGWIEPVFAYSGIKTFLSSDGASFQRHDIAVPGTFCADIASGDLNGDGRPEIILAGREKPVGIIQNQTAPALRINRETALLSWPTWPGYALESTVNIESPTWQTVTEEATISQGVNTLPLSADPKRFYRLRQTE